MKMNRRQFLAAGALIAIGGHAAETSHRLIDCQSHLFCEEIVKLMEKRKTDPVVFIKDGVRVVKMGERRRR
jgi:hypothetical protein